MGLFIGMGSPHTERSCESWDSGTFCVTETVTQGGRPGLGLSIAVAGSIAGLALAGVSTRAGFEAR